MSDAQIVTPNQFTISENHNSVADALARLRRGLELAASM
jgi:hypothetical protein